jgi:hypothetical protein
MKGMDMYRATDGPSFFFFFFFFCIPRAGSFRSPQYIFVFRLSLSSSTASATFLPSLCWSLLLLLL